MKLKIKALAALALSAASIASSASTSMRLDTGFNHATGAYFAAGPTDIYWQVISKYPLVAPLPVSPSHVLLPLPSGWLLNTAPWISAFPGGISPTSSGSYDPGYTIYRKCFCVMPEALVQTPTQNSALSLTARLRADDNVQVWLNNSLSGQLLIPQSQTGRWGSGSPINVVAQSSKFRPYVNCLYVFVEDDQGGRTGFSMTGSVSANFGLWDQAGSADPNSFKPCPCKAPGQHVGATGAKIGDTEHEDLQEIVKYAETRRVARQKAGKPSAPRALLPQ